MNHIKNNITVKNVKCGDSSTIKIGNHQLIIDCGSNNRGNCMNSSQFAYDTIKDDVTNCFQTDLLISHFDKDHFNGVLCIPESENNLDHVYLPYSIINHKAVYVESISKLLYCAPPRSWGYELSSEIMELFKKIGNLVNNKSNIMFLKSGDTINVGNRKIRILWPDCNFNIDKLKLTDFKTKIAISAFEPYIFKNNNDEIELGEIDARLEYRYKKILEQIDYNFDSLVISQERFKNVFQNYLEFLHNGVYDNGEFEDIEHQLFQLVEESKIMNKSLWDSISNNDAIKNELVNLFRWQYHQLIRTMNAISIVCDYKDQFIFLGDLPSEIIEYIKDRFNKKYQIVKVQHHGTKNYYTRFTPYGQKYIISNGGFKNRKISEQFISSFCSSEIICTSAHSQAEQFCYYRIEQGKCNDSCYKMGSKVSLPIT